MHWISCCHLKSSQNNCCLGGTSMPSWEWWWNSSSEKRSPQCQSSIGSWASVSPTVVSHRHCVQIIFTFLWLILKTLATTLHLLSIQKMSTSRIMMIIHLSLPVVRAQNHHNVLLNQLSIHSLSVAMTIHFTGHVRHLPWLWQAWRMAASTIPPATKWSCPCSVHPLPTSPHSFILTSHHDSPICSSSRGTTPATSAATSMSVHLHSVPSCRWSQHCLAWSVVWVSPCTSFRRTYFASSSEKSPPNALFMSLASNQEITIGQHDSGFGAFFSSPSVCPVIDNKRLFSDARVEKNLVIESLFGASSSFDHNTMGSLSALSSIEICATLVHYTVIASLALMLARITWALLRVKQIDHRAGQSSENDTNKWSGDASESFDYLAVEQIITSTVIVSLCSKLGFHRLAIVDVWCPRSKRKVGLRNNRDVIMSRSEIFTGPPYKRIWEVEGDDTWKTLDKRQIQCRFTEKRGTCIPLFIFIRSSHLSRVLLRSFGTQIASIAAGIRRSVFGRARTCQETEDAN